MKLLLSILLLCDLTTRAATQPPQTVTLAWCEAQPVQGFVLSYTSQLGAPPVTWTQTNIPASDCEIIGTNYFWSNAPAAGNCMFYALRASNAPGIISGWATAPAPLAMMVAAPAATKPSLTATSVKGATAMVAASAAAKKPAIGPPSPPGL